MSSPLVTLHNATCGYGARDILTDVDLEIRAGEAVALLGSNGAGKSTLLKAITGLAALRGMATIDASLGYVPQYQDSDLSFPVTAYKVVEMGLLPSVSWWHRCTSMRSYRDCVLNALRQVGMEHLAETRFGQLSGGQRQRVLIARALVSAPELVLLDEPFNGLDQESRRILIQIIADLKEAGIALLVSTHDPSWRSTPATGRRL
ncbi:metal ABC transporter ATP-binding protein [Corynebacterium sp. HMSC071F07]|uniref:metal ABC transporter ATP-binding protein n=1 Tax=Corynebacterium sp. HMSC071F07 TaxID=1715203 RepID=UPI000ABBF6AA|nr:ATP-binding cassette domain-containing protein [Corynebacterium sp. HMSC071F07]